MKAAIILALMSIVVSVHASRILLYPFDHLAHVNSFSIIGEELKNRGHIVDIIVANRSEYLAAQRGINAIVRAYKHSLDHSVFENAASGGIFAQRDYVAKLFETGLEHVRELFDDKPQLAKLQATNYDLMLVEGSDVGRTQFLLPYKLGVKFISVGIRHDPWSAKIPALPSVEGVQAFCILNQDSTFFDRLTNTALTLFFQNMVAPPSYLSGVHDGLFEELVPEKVNIGFGQLHRKSEIFLILMDILCTDTHRISAPHYHFIGGLGAKDAQPLPTELKQFMDSANHGAIVLSFGSGMKRIPMDMLEPMISVFIELKQKVIMRHDGEKPKSLPTNVLIQKWLPQNDLLGHPNTKLFITHCGNNGQLEGVYHGIPMLMLPWMADQFYNSARAETRGYGLISDPKHFNIDDFRAKLLELLTNPSYYEKSKKCSKILHSLPSPQHTAAFWIEHVLHHGSDHLKPYYMDMPSWKFWMLDIILFECVVFLLLICSLKWCCSRFCFVASKSKTKKE